MNPSIDDPSNNQPTRREFLKTSAAVAAVSTVPFWFATGESRADVSRSANERHVLGCIGTGSRWEGDIGKQAMRFADCVAVCDVDSERVGSARERVDKIQGEKGKAKPVEMFSDYRRILDRKDIDVVTIVTPDHWHTKIAIEAMRAGKDVYCEKPLTLTIDEGKQISKVVDETKRVLQVGTQQRSQDNLNFLTAIAMIRDGRIGQVKRCVVDIGAPKASGPLKKMPPPPNLNWEMWQGQTPRVEYIPKRCHYEFRWWYEYSGGKLTDWGAHHVDIAQWAIGMDHSGPVTVEPVHRVHPVPLKNGYPTVDNEYNTAIEFTVRCMFPNNVEISIQHTSPDGNGILFEGTEGRFHVSRPGGRGKRRGLKGKPVDDLKDKPLPEDLITKLYKGKKPGSHMGNFFECVKSRDLPISDVYTHHRILTTCHLGNIALRLGRSLTWDPKSEHFVGDAEAEKWLSREQRKGYEINA